MTDTALDQDSEGLLCDLEGNAPLILSDPERIWLIGSGAVDVFASHVTGGRPDGARIHLFRADASQVLFGIRPNPIREDIALLAVGLPGTRLVTLSRSRLLRLTEVLGFSQDALAWVDNWIAQLSKAIADPLPAAKYRLLKPGETIELAAGDIACCPRGTVWVRQLEGAAQFMERTDLRVSEGEQYFPVSQHCWIRSHTAGRIAVVNTETCLRQDPAWSSLEDFHETVFQCVIWNTDDIVKAERERLKNRAAAERQAMAGALVQLASVLDKRPQTITADAHPEPLAEACRLVAEAAGIRTAALSDNRAAPAAAEQRIAEISREWRFRTRKVVLRDNWWRGDYGPLLAFVERDQRPVALIPTSAESYDIVDPTEARRSRVTAEVAALLGYFGHVFYRPLRDQNVTAARLITFALEGCRRDIGRVVVLGMLIGLLAMMTPIATSLIFDSIIPGAHRIQLVQLAAALVVAALGSVMFTLTRNIAIRRIQGRMSLAVQSGIWDRILSLPVSFFRRFSSGDLASRAIGIEEIRQVLTGSVLSALVTGIASISSFALLVYYDFSLALLGAGLLALGVTVPIVASYAQLRLQRRFYDIAGRLSGMVLEFVTGIAKLRVCGAERRAFAVWASDFAEQRRIAIGARRIGIAQSVFESVFSIVVSMVLFAAVSRDRAGASLSTGHFLAFYAAFGQCLAAVMSMGDAITSVLYVAPLYERTRPILETPPEVDLARVDPGPLTGAIEISHVSFRYRPDSPLILDDISIAIRPGEFVAFVGPSGAGKSTLLRLLLGFETPEAGAIYYDGQDLATLDRQAVRRRIGVVLQSGKLIPGDILSNIIGSAPLNIDDAWEAARRAGLDDDIKAMPMGMHTVIGEGGATFSGGQRQRLLIARAIVSRPRVLMFDEATSALDNRTQALVSRSLEELQATRIVIAHRLSTIRNADQIYVVQAGRIAQQGRYEELMEQQGTFAALARRQLV